MSVFQYITLLIVSVTLIGVAIGRYPVLRMNRATIVLVGSALLIFINAISFDQALSSIDLNTITLLFCMMIINVNLRICGFFDLITQKVIRIARTPSQLLILVIFSSGILSALFLNDTIVLVYTPLVLEITSLLGLNPIPYLIATACAANVGSAATIIGNPQNMLIGISSGISFLDFTLNLAPVALGALLFVWLVVSIVYRKQINNKKFFVEPEIKIKLYFPLFYKSMIAAVIMIILLLLDYPIPLSALVASSILLVTRRLKPERVFREIDWSLLVFFSGLFVVTASIDTSKIGSHLFSLILPLLQSDFATFSIISAVVSNIVSNVPAVLLFKPVVPLLQNANTLWLLLAVSTTFAGNLTLLGSVANLIVAESAKSRGVKLSFKEYLKAGIPVTVLTLLFSVIWFTLFF
ncbi:MAG TPA: anion transporter [Ignavibacteriaceae bacterium]|nr:anion transporter [Ignavibacteriaceae bacterium]